MNPGILGRRRGGPRANRKSNRGPNRPQPTAAIGIAEASVDGSVLTVEFDQVVSLGKIVPKYTTDVIGALPVSAQQTSPSTIEITYSNSVAAATEVRIPYEDKGVRNASGGFVCPSTFQI